MTHLTTNGINPAEIRAILNSPEYQTKIRAAEKHQPTDHEKHTAAQIMFRDLVAGRSIDAGTGRRVFAADVLRYPEAHELLVRHSILKQDCREDITDMVMEWCLQQAPAVIHNNLIQEIEAQAIEANQSQERAA